jgi:peptidoglycan/LPS O-acetylase OafA/YrhL
MTKLTSLRLATKYATTDALVRNKRALPGSLSALPPAASSGSFDEGCGSLARKVASKSERIIRLEACRGIAALIVVCGHIIAGFEPRIYGVVGTRIAGSLVGTVFDVAINGAGAVIFFFVLSGYVLTARFFEKPNPDYMAVAAMKRLPRLALLTTIVTLGSALIWLLGLYRFQEASQITGSEWLRTFAEANLPDNFRPSLFGALQQGAWRTFITGDSYLDTSLWTMTHELHGSLVVFVGAPFLLFVLKKRFMWLATIFAAIVFCFASIYMVPFICGMSIAYHRPKILRFSSPLLTGMLFLIGIYLLGFILPVRHYLIFAKLTFWNPASASGSTFQILVLTVGAMGLVIAVLRSSVAERVLDNRFGALLGHLSFPIYLVHVPIILSASSAIYLALWSSIGSNAIWVAGACTLILTFAISWPLASIDVKWVRLLNGRIGALLR